MVTGNIAVSFSLDAALLGAELFLFIVLNPASLLWASENLELITLEGSWMEMQPSLQSPSKHVTLHVHIYIHGHVSVSDNIGGILQL